MLCSHCKKNPATVHYKSVINDQITQWDLCAPCAQEKGLSFFSEQGFSLFPAPFESLSELIAQLANQSMPEQQEAQGLKCAQCGLTSGEFQRAGRFGCDACYTSFEPLMESLLSHIHGHTRHTGKTARTSGAQAPDLQQQLKVAIAREDFERAAELRDELKRRKKNGTDPLPQ